MATERRSKKGSHSMRMCKRWCSQHRNNVFTIQSNISERRGWGGCMKQMIFPPMFSYNFFFVKTVSVAKKNVCVWEKWRKISSWIAHQKFRRHFFLRCHGILTPLHLKHFIPFLLQLFRLLLHPPFITIFPFALLFSCLSASHDDFSYYFVRFHNNEKKWIAAPCSIHESDIY